MIAGADDSFHESSAAPISRMMVVEMVYPVSKDGGSSFREAVRTPRYA
jgi:hypothetical protein